MFEINGMGRKHNPAATTVPIKTSTSMSHTYTHTSLKHFSSSSSSSAMDFIFSTVKYLTENHLIKTPIFSNLAYYLVDHQKIVDFSWKQGETIGSSLKFLTFTILFYLLLTFTLSSLSMIIVPYVGHRLLKTLTTAHNLVLVSLSFVMAVGSTLSIILHSPNLEYVVCYPKNTPPRGPLFFWAYVFYLSKVYEFTDTLLIILSNSFRRLTFLHVYHHAAVLIMCYMSLRMSQSMFPVVVVVNGTVHVVMYFYYLLCTLGRKPSWKKLVTDCQILQFFSSFGIMAWIFYYHLTGAGCSGIWGWCFDAVFITSLLVLFLDFHSKNYSNKGSTKGGKEL